MTEPHAPLEPGLDRSVARVLVDVPLAHLDRPFDYAVAAEIAEAARPGCRVRVRFAGKEVGGFVLERLQESEYAGALTPIRRVVSSEPVLAPAVARLCRLVADRYAGVVADVLRLAVPPRHARVEKEPTAGTPEPEDIKTPSREEGMNWLASTDPPVWPGLDSGPAFVDRLRTGSAPRAVATLAPGSAWPAALAHAAAITLLGGRGALLCLPDTRDVQRVADALLELLGGDAADPAGPVAVLTADLGPAPRYRAFLSAARGHARIVVGTRAAAFAPVHDLGLVAMWDDGDDLFAEPRAPYPHTREVLALRAHHEHSALLIAGFARTAEAQILLDSGWAQPLRPSRAVVRAASPHLSTAGESDAELARDTAARAARLPHRAFEAARAGLVDGPVLVQVPRTGYLPALACAVCRAPGRCVHCQGPLSLHRAMRTATCRWCGRVSSGWHCPRCGANRFRAPVVGSQRTAEELGRAFPQTPVVSSSAGHVHARLAPRPALVVATPGAEPVVDGGYSVALLLDAWLTLARPDLRTSEEALRRWLNAAALVRPADQGGRVVVIGDPALQPVQALLRWDPAGAAERELADRVAARLPPAAKTATITGASTAVADFVRTLEAPDRSEVLGPLQVEEQTVRAVVRCPREDSAALVAALKVAQSIRSARKDPTVRVQVDPHELG